MENKIEIGGASHPLIFNMRAIESIMSELNMADFSELGDSLNSQNIAKSLAFARCCAYYGIKSGYRKAGEKFPFVDIDDFADAIDSFAEVEPAIVAFTKAIEDFFKPKKGSEDLSGK